MTSCGADAECPSAPRSMLRVIRIIGVAAYGQQMHERF
jgi:hypothetical protein